MVDKESFKEQIKAYSTDYTSEINFQEAVREYFRATTNSSVPEEVMGLIQGQSGCVLNKESSAFR